MIHESYFIGSRLLGAANWDLPECAAQSVAYFCMECGEVWARRSIFPSSGWQVAKTVCLKCGDGRLLLDVQVNSFLDGVDSFPLEVLQWDFLRRVEYERTLLG